MGKQSARMVYRGKDHKDIYYQGNYHNAMYKGGQLVWKKIYDRYCSFDTNRIFDLDSKEIIMEDGCIYRYITIHHSIQHSFAIFQNSDTKEYFIAFSRDLLNWKRVKELDNFIDEQNYSALIANFDGFWIYRLNRKDAYYVQIDESDNSYVVKKAEIPAINLYPFQSGGISNNFYAIHRKQVNNNILYIAKRNGEIEEKKLGYPFNINTAPIPRRFFANIEDNIYIIANYSSTYISRTYIFHISNLETDFISTAFDSYGSSFFHNKPVGIDIVYSSTQILLLIHNGIEEGPYGDVIHTEWYDNIAYYIIYENGNIGKVLEKDDNKDLVMPLYGSDKHDTFTLKFIREKYIEPGFFSPIDDGMAYYSQLQKDSASNFQDTSLEILEGYRNAECIIGRYENSSGILVVYIDNLFLQESEGNFAFIIKKQG